MDKDYFLIGSSLGTYVGTDSAGMLDWVNGVKFALWFDTKAEAAQWWSDNSEVLWISRNSPIIHKMNIEVSAPLTVDT